MGRIRAPCRFLQFDNKPVLQFGLAKGSRQNFDLRDWHCQSASPFANIRQLLSYLILEVPRKNQDIVRLCFTDPRRFEDWNMSAREKLAMFVGIAVYRVDRK